MAHILGLIAVLLSFSVGIGVGDQSLFLPELQEVSPWLWLFLASAVAAALPTIYGTWAIPRLHDGLRPQSARSIPASEFQSSIWTIPAYLSMEFGLWIVGPRDPHLMTSAALWWFFGMMGFFLLCFGRPQATVAEVNHRRGHR